MENKNTDNNEFEVIQSITPEEMDSTKSQTIKYLQYISILFSIMFSIAGIYFFLGWMLPQNGIPEKGEIPEIYSGGIQIGNYIWSKEIKKRVDYQTANDFCHNLEPRGKWRLPWNNEIWDTFDGPENFSNNILTEDGWYLLNMDSASGPWCYNPKINTSTNCDGINTEHSGKDVIVRCITEASNIIPGWKDTFPNCDDDNISLSNGQTWAACNLGASKKWDGVSFPERCENSIGNCNKNLKWLGNYYQYGSNTENFGLPYSGYGGTKEEVTYYDPEHGLLWGNADESERAKQGPCPSGWHVPTFVEWRDAYRVTGNNIGSLRTVLKLPPTGYRNKTGGFVFSSEKEDSSRSNYTNIPTYYWSSSIVGQTYSNTSSGKSYYNPDVMMLDFTSMEPAPFPKITYFKKGFEAYAIRCIKNTK